MEPTDLLLAEQARYDAAIQWLCGRINYERNAVMPGRDGELKLDRMRELLVRLGNPERQLKIIHVAGTKGKGSTSTMIASALTTAGLRTGLFTSPHLDRIEQRIAIDGQPCCPRAFARILDKIWPVVQVMDEAAASSGAVGPTYFEILTAMAFLHYADEQVDAVVLEVGLGGRLDSTNVCTSVVSVITSISFDHTQQLGNSLESIAREKAGIIKPGVAVICGVCEAGPREEIHQIARERGSRVVQLRRDFDFVYHPPQPGSAEQTPYGSIDFVYQDEPQYSARRVAIGLLGRHQGTNAAVALATLTQLQRLGWPLSESAIRAGLATASLPARIEVVGRRPTVVVDAAHNVASIEALLSVLAEHFVARRRLLLFATTQDKDTEGMLARLLPHFDEVVLTRYTNNPRAIPADQLAEIASRLYDRPLQVVADPALAWEYARRFAQPDDLVCITGSFFLAGEVRRLISAHPIGQIVTEKLPLAS